jgi:hypothetical protein
VPGVPADCAEWTVGYSEVEQPRSQDFFPITVEKRHYRRSGSSRSGLAGQGIKRHSLDHYRTVGQPTPKRARQTYAVVRFGDL